MNGNESDADNNSGNEYEGKTDDSQTPSNSDISSEELPECKPSKKTRSSIQSWESASHETMRAEPGEPYSPAKLKQKITKKLPCRKKKITENNMLMNKFKLQ